MGFIIVFRSNQERLPRNFFYQLKSKIDRRLTRAAYYCESYFRANNLVKFLLNYGDLEVYYAEKAEITKLGERTILEEEIGIDPIPIFPGGGYKERKRRAFQERDP